MSIERQQLTPDEFMRMSIEDRLALVRTGVIDDLASASPEVQAFADKAAERYRAAFVQTD